VIGDAVTRAHAFSDEVVVADGSSPDDTVARARAAGARVVVAPKGRGAQLDAGARAAEGDVLLFLHADAVLEPGAREAIARALADPAVVGGNFRLVFDGAKTAARLFGLANDVRRRLFAVYYGDSALFVRRETFLAIGGVRPLPIFEDYDFVRRLERSGATAYVRDVSVRASSRRFAGRPVRTLALWTTLQLLYSAGLPAERLARWYRDAR